jgi:hemolysin III
LITPAQTETIQSQPVNGNYTLREPFSAISHLFSAVLALVGTLFLLIYHPGNWLQTSAIILYGLGMIGMFLSSGIYHAHSGTPGTMLILRKLDHSAIYIFIAATYTPICIHLLSGWWRVGLFATVWMIALIGIIVKMFVIQAPRWITAGVYLVMGWISVFAINALLQVLTWGELSWLFLGGMFYTLGAIIYITRKFDFRPGVFGFHEVWHLFVIAAAACHYIFIFRVI